MDINTKLRLITEGYSIEEINSGNIATFSQMVEGSVDELTLFAESFHTDINFISQINLEMIRESTSESDKRVAFKKVIDWLIQKIQQFKKFITDLFRKKKQSVINTQKETPVTNVKSTTVNGILHKFVSSPDGAIKDLNYLLINFGLTSESLYKSGSNELKKSGTELKVAIWKKVVNNPSISYNQDVTLNVIEHRLGGRKSVTITTKQQIENIYEFAEDFYDMTDNVNKDINGFENMLRELRESDEEGLDNAKRICEVIISTFTEFIRVVDRDVGMLVAAAKAASHADK